MRSFVPRLIAPYPSTISSRIRRRANRSRRIDGLTRSIIGEKSFVIARRLKREGGAASVENRTRLRKINNAASACRESRVFPEWKNSSIRRFSSSSRCISIVRSNDFSERKQKPSRERFLRIYHFRRVMENLIGGI